MVKLTVWFKTKKDETEAVLYFFRHEKRAKEFALAVAERWEATWHLEKKGEENLLKKVR